jgi:hypothetical protein
MQAAQSGGICFAGISLVFIAIFAANTLIAPRTKGPAPVFGRGAIACDQHAAHIAPLAGVFEGLKELINRVGAEGIAYLGTIEGYAHGALLAGPVVSNICKVKPGHGLPSVGVEERGGICGHGFFLVGVVVFSIPQLSKAKKKRRVRRPSRTGRKYQGREI